MEMKNTLSSLLRDKDRTTTILPLNPCRVIESDGIKVVKHYQVFKTWYIDIK